MNRCCGLVCVFGFSLFSRAAPPAYLDDQFELPSGFHIYRMAEPELTGGSYDLCFDGQGRLLVGDGNAIRRLSDRDQDGVFDSFEVIAAGLGWRGPQGLLVYGDRLYAIGGDGLQLYEGYRSGRLLHRGRLGNTFSTGGDHDAHTLLRGHDGYVYLVTGDGAGTKDRRHITEESSPVQRERAACVFRISPDGKRWECIGAGGRNPPNLGMNYLGELFSFDSDMEWHVGLPWWRPVRLNHWAVGGDQGWQEVGAYPSYYLDCLPGILEVGRGSPTWGVFYEHNQLPEKYRDAFIVCDYRWKRESNDQYHTSGRLLAFFLTPAEAGWKAAWETLAKPKPGGRETNGRAISFALVDVEVAPDGSLFISDHNQGIWRLFYDGKATRASAPPAHTDWPGSSPAGKGADALMEQLLTLPQPASEWSRIREEALRESLGGPAAEELQAFATNIACPLPKRLRSLRLLAPDFERLPDPFLALLAGDDHEIIRGQAAWLFGLGSTPRSVDALVKLLGDDAPFVRRRAAEAFTRNGASGATAALVEHLGDTDRLVRYVAMTALARRPSTTWLESALAHTNPQVRLRALVAARLRGETPSSERLRDALTPLLREPSLPREDRLDLLRTLGLFRDRLETDVVTGSKVREYLSRGFPDRDREIRWEQVRLLGDYRCSEAFGKLLALLESEREEPTQFHAAQSLARLPEGWTELEEQRLIRWFQGTQRGWFADFAGKGVEFPHFWATVLADLGTHHRAALLQDLSPIDFTGLLGDTVLELLTREAEPAEFLLALHRVLNVPEARLKIVRVLSKVPHPTVSAFLREQYLGTSDPRFRGVALQSLAAQPDATGHLTLFVEGLRHPDPEVVRVCAQAIGRSKPTLTEELAKHLLDSLLDRRQAHRALERTLVAVSGVTPPGFDGKADPARRPEERARGEALEFWKNWYARQFGRSFVAAAGSMPVEKSDEEIHRFILSAVWQASETSRGAKVYESVQCQTCHGGGVTPGREGTIFGPELGGVTRRLSRAELADALVYPSRQVADRFKGIQIERTDGTVLSGFITEETPASVTLVDRDQVHRLARSQIKSLAPQTASLMPERLLNRLSWEQIRDLLAFLENEKSPSQTPRR